MRDISDRQQLLAFLSSIGIFPLQDAGKLYVRYFGGGVSGTVALVSDGKKSVIAKQALAALKVAELWECDQSRMLIEHKALEVYARLVPDYVPKPIYCDEEDYIMVREAAPESCPMWKTQLLEGLLDFRVANKSIMALSTVHNRTASDAGVRETFRDGEVFYNLRINPYIERVAEKHPAIRDEAGEVCRMLMNERIALIHGDYSPKNILVSGEDIYILDMEVAYFGHPAFDVAFFTNHFLLKSVKNKRWSGAYLNMLQYMTGLYFRNVTCMNAQVMEKQTVRTLALLFLARVDGKSPAEYITDEADKTLIRTIAFRMIERRPETFRQVAELVQAHIENAVKGD